MSMFAHVFQRNPELVVVWLDDELFQYEQAETSIFYTGILGIPGDKKAQLLHILYQGTPYSLLLSDENEKEGDDRVIDRDKAASQRNKFDGQGRPLWMADEAWRILAKAKRVYWILDLRTGGDQDPYELYRVQRPAIAALSARERGMREHRVAVLTQVRRAMADYVIDRTVGGEPDRIFLQGEAHQTVVDTLRFLRW